MLVRQLQSALKAGETTAVAVAEAARSRIVETQPVLKAATVLSSKQEVVAQAEAAASAGGSLAGVPILVKDCLDVKGFATTLGSPELCRGLAGSVYTRKRAADAPAVGKLREAGAVIMGKSNLPDKGLDVQTFNDMYGTTGTPYDPSRAAGGSSGGSAAAVSAGLVPLAVGTDLAGSLRIPAAFCGISSLRPSPGRVPSGGISPPAMQTGPEFESSLQVGPMAKDISGLEAFLEAAAVGPDLSSPFVAGTAAKAPKVLITPALAKAPTDDRIQEMLRTTLPEILAGAQSSSSSSPPPVECTVGDGPALDQKAIGAAYFSFARRLFIEHGPPSPKHLASAVEVRDALRKQLDDELFGDYDAWILPVCGTLPFAHNPDQLPIPMSGQEKDVPYWRCFLPYALPFTVSSSPVLTMPVGMVDGLPVGVQVVGKQNGDEALLAVGKAIEAAVGPLPQPAVFAPYRE